jgi:hypothetical protein
MKIKLHILALATVLTLHGQAATAGVVNPDCTAEKAAKSAATKATVGVGGRCSPAEAAKDTLGPDKDKDKDKHKGKDKDKDNAKDKDKEKDKDD